MKSSRATRSGRSTTSAEHQPRSSPFANRLSRSRRNNTPQASARRRNMAFLRYGTSSSTSDMNRTREHARQIAMKLTMDSPISIQSSSTFADFGAAFPESDNDTKQQPQDNNMFDSDPFAKPDDTAFVTDWPSNDQSMLSMPNNSSMQSKYYTTTSESPLRNSRPTSQLRTSRSAQPQAGSAGTVARRRFRSQARSSSLARIDDTSDSSVPGTPVSGSVTSSTPPQSPHNNHRRNHVTTYKTTARSDIYDHNDDAVGFTFDAFGLDAAQVNRELNEAMQDLAGSSVGDLSFFDDDFTGSTHTAPWENSPVSRSSTPDQGFVDGFKVSKTARHSPASTERSSLTSESDGGRHNLFKEQAGFGRRPVIQRPEKKSNYRMTSPKKIATVISRNNNQLPSMPVLDDSAKVESPRSNPDVGFFDDGESTDSAQEPQNEAAHSDVAVGSDVAVNSDAAVSPDIAVKQNAVVGVPKKSGTASTSGETYRTESTISTSQEEKKEDQSSVKSFGNLRSQFEKASPATRETPTKRSFRPSPTQATRKEDVNDRNHEFSPGSLRSDRAYVGSRSEAGPALRHTSVSAILSKIESTSPRSDSGAPSPSVYSVRLKKTGVQTSLMQAQQRNDTFTEKAPSPVVKEPNEKSPEQPRKLTYRERRELELQKDKNQSESEQPSSPAQRDVASMIKRRIAVNKRNAETPVSPSVSQSESFVDQRDKLKSLGTVEPTKSFVEQLERLKGVSPRGREDASVSEEIEAPSPPLRRKEQPKPAPRKADLVIETERPQPTSNKVEASAAVSRMLMLQQIQTRNPSPPPSPSRSTQDIMSSASGEEHRKSNTPKATMMMLNAFLSGRDSLGSEGAPAAPKATAEAKADPQPPRSPDNPHGLPALKDDPKYKRFFKMLSIGLPMDAVKHAMLKEGLDPDVMDGDHNKPVGLPLRLDPTYSKYFKMLSIGLPMEAVKHAMARDGLDPLVMDGDHNLPVQTVVKKVAVEKKKKDDEEKDSHRRARLHWKTLRKVTSNSLWAKIDQEGLTDDLDIDENEFRELFQAEKNSTTPMKSMSPEKAKKGATVRVIDPKRANNGGIILARLKMSHDEMADAVDRINDSVLTAEQIEHMIEYLPTKEERKALETYMLEGGQDAAEKFDGLCECEKFMVSMMTVKHAKRKIRALLFKLQFESCVQDIQQDAFLVEAACDELTSSVRLRQLLGFVLEFGNRLNTAGTTKKQKAGAFTLDSLLKLNQAKAFDKKTTFLNYFIQVVQRKHELLLQFKDDLPTVFKADKIFWDQCVGDLEEVENQLENVRKISLYQARQHKGYRLRKKNRHQRDEDEESLSDGDFSFTLEEEVEMLRATPVGMFTLSAIKYISALRGKIEETRHKYANVLEYFGEEDKNMSPHELFSVIVHFSRDFDRAKEQVATSQKRKMRDDRKRKASKNKDSNGKPPPYSPVPVDRKKVEVRVSNHQPSMSNVINDLQQKKTPLRKVAADKPPAVRTGPPNVLNRYNPVRSSGETRVPSNANDRTVENSVPSPVSVSSNRSSRSISLREKARLRYMKNSAAGNESRTMATTTPGANHSPAPTESDQDASAVAESSRASFRHRRRLEQRRLRSVRGTATS